MLAASSGTVSPGDRLQREDTAVLGLLKLSGAVEDNTWHARACLYFPVKQVENRLSSPKYHGCVRNGNSFRKLVCVWHYRDILFPKIVEARKAHEWRHYILIAHGLPRGSFVIVWYREEYLDGRYESPLCNLLKLRTAEGLHVLGETVALVVTPVVGCALDLSRVFALPITPIYHAKTAFVNLPHTAMRVTKAHEEIERAQTDVCETRHL